MRLRYAVAALTLVLATSSAAQAVTLWDQSTIVPAGPGIPASYSSGFGGFISYAVDDVTVPAPGWVVTKITQWYSAFDPNWVGGVTQGYVNVYPKSGPLPLATDLPSAVLVPMSCVNDAAQSAAVGQPVIAAFANVNINLPAGQYWIGIAPRRSPSPLGVNRMWPSATVGDPVALHLNGAAWAQAVGNWDGAFRVEGEVPVPTEPTSWGSMKALYH